MEENWGNITPEWGEEKAPDGEHNNDVSFDEKTLKKFVEKSCQVIEKVNEIGLPKEKEQLRLITMRAINTISIIKMICEREICEKAIFVIFAINQNAARVLIDLKRKGYLKQAEIIVSSIRNAGYKSKSIAVDMLKSHFDVIFVHSHAKISILNTAQGNYYNVEGSGNFSFNARIEQYIIDNDKIIYEFSKQWMNELMKYKQNSFINKLRENGTK